MPIAESLATSTPQCNVRFQERVRMLTAHARLVNHDGTFQFYSTVYRLPDLLAGREVFVFTDGEQVYARPMHNGHLDGPAILAERGA